MLAPVVTPFRRDLSPDPERFARHGRWLLAHGCEGLAVFGTNSEANSLSAEERIELLEALLRSGVPASRLLPGTGCCSLPETVRLTRHAVEQGCAGVLMLPPFYYKGVSDDGLYRHFAEVIERVAAERLRVYLYHIPPVAQVGISLPLVERLLAAYPRAIAGIKDSSGDWDNTRSLIDAFAADGFAVFAGSERFLLRTLRAGGAGCITAGANVNPHGIAGVLAGWQSPQAEGLQARIDGVRAILQAQASMIPALKATIARYSDDPAWLTVRPPLVELTGAEREGLAAALAAAGFEMPGLRE